MSDKKISSIDIAFALGLLAFLFTSYGFDRASYSIGKYATSHEIKSLSFGGLIPLVYPTITLLVSTIAFLIFWVMVNKLYPSKWVKIFYLVIGLLIIIAYSLSRMFKSPDSFPNLLEQTFWPLSHLYVAGSLIAVTGFLILVLPENKNKKGKTFLFNTSLLVGLPIFLCICHIFDVITFLIPPYFSKYKILFWYYPIALLLIVVPIMLLFWYTQKESYFKKWREILFLIIGVLITYAYNILHLRFVQELIPAYLFGSQTPAIILLQDIFWPNYYLHIAGTLVAGTGLLSSFLPKK